MSDDASDIPSYYLSPFFPGVHKEPAQPPTTGLSQDELNSLRDKLITSILQVFSQAVLGTVDPTGTLSGVLSQLGTWATSIPILGTIVQALTGGFGDLTSLTTFGNNIKTFFDGIDLTDPSFDFESAAETFVTNVVQPFITAVTADLKGLVEKLFGVDIGSEDPLTAVTRLGGNLQSFLANIDFNQDSSDFNPIQQLTSWLQSVGTPGGILNSTTPIPPHLYGALNIGQYLTVPGFTNTIYNQQPDPDMLDANAIIGGGVWSYDATKTASTGVTGAGSYKATGSSVVREGIFVPIPTKPGQTTDLGIFTAWTGATASTGQSLKLIAYAYDANDDLISDSLSVVCVIPNLPASSSGYTGTDPISGNALAANGSGWVQMTGVYRAPTGTVNVRLAFDIDSTVSAGTINISKVTQSVRDGFIDVNQLTNVDGFLGQWQLPNLQGFADLLDGNTTWETLLDGLATAANPSGSVSGADFSTVFTLIQQGTTNTGTALQNAVSALITLGQRTNKSMGTGANSTSQSSLEIGHYSSGGSMVTSSLAPGTGMGMVYTVPEVATYGFLDTLMQIPSGTNDVRVNVFQINPTTNVKSALFNSSNLATTVGTASITIPNRVVLPGMPLSMPGDKLLFEIFNASATNSLTVASKNNVIANHPSELISNIGWTRATASGGASPTSLTSAQGTYGPTNTFANVGIAVVPADYHPPAKDDWTIAGSYSETMPSWLDTGDFIDVQGEGGGGGGGSSLGPVGGQGGGSAAWGTHRLVVGTDIKKGSSYSWVVGGRGATSTGNSGSTPGTGGNGANGGDTTFTYTDPSNVSHTLTFAGGQWGAWGPNNNSSNPNGNTQSGMAATPITVDGITYPAGSSVSPGATGQSPGGGGGGAISWLEGGPGGVGQLSLYRAQS